MLENSDSIIEITPKEAEFDPAKVQKFLKEKKMSQAELARIAGYNHRNVVNKIIKSNKTASASDLVKFCLALNKDVRDFVK